MLGLKRSATRPEIKKRFNELASKYHPDRFAMRGDRLYQRMTKKFAILSDARDRCLKAAR
jgi:DnaJ-class molecular chaperone